MHKGIENSRDTPLDGVVSVRVRQDEEEDLRRDVSRVRGLKTTRDFVQLKIAFENKEEED